MKTLKMAGLLILSLLAVIGAFTVYEKSVRPESDSYAHSIHETQSDFEIMESALIMYWSNNGDFPTNEQGLEILLKKTKQNNDIPYLQEIRNDRFGEQYGYSIHEQGVLLWSEGSKAKFGVTLSYWIKYPAK